VFYYLSKIFWLFAQPLNLSILMLAPGLVAGFLGARRLARWTAGLAFLVLALSAWTSAGQLMLSPLEDRFPRPPAPARVDGIVVLGGGFEGAVNKVRGGYDLNAGGDRFVGELLLDGEDDATTAARLLTALGVAPERLVLESRSRNTYENAVFTRRMVSPEPGETWLLVTSAFHMPRAKALFDKAGFPTVPWPVDYRTTGREGIGLLRDNPLDSLQTTTLAIREWTGLLAYRLTGRIDSLFPGPAG
jgi:uncharacterized SAM-binding protein YcdF (DUF218 family)